MNVKVTQYEVRQLFELRPLPRDGTSLYGSKLSKVSPLSRGCKQPGLLMLDGVLDSADTSLGGTPSNCKVVKRLIVLASRAG